MSPELKLYHFYLKLLDGPFLMDGLKKDEPETTLNGAWKVQLNHMIPKTRGSRAPSRL